jgi:hypothetical protein
MKKIWLALLAVCALIIITTSCGTSSNGSRDGATLPSTSTTVSPGGTTPGVGTPLACPSGATTITTSTVPTFAINTNYCFSAGTYSAFSRAIPSGDSWYGGGFAILNGNNNTQYAINDGTASNIIFDGFTVQNYSTANQGNGAASTECINFQHGTNITISNNTIGPDNAGAISFDPGAPQGQYSSGAYSVGVNNSVITHNKIFNVGYSGTTISGSSNDVVSYNDVSGTDLFNDDREFDVSSVGKFAVDENTTVIGNNIHDSNDSALWFDVYNVNNYIENNTITNTLVGIFYEISCNAIISGNVISDVGYGDAGHGTGAAGSAIRISSSGSSTQDQCASFNSDGSMPGVSPGGDIITVSGNTLTDNHEGITEFEGHAGYPINNVHNTGNTITGDSTGTGGDSDAWLQYTDSTGLGNTWANNVYHPWVSHLAAFTYNGTTANYSSWNGATSDSGSSCTNTSGGSC